MERGVLVAIAADAGLGGAVAGVAQGWAAGRGWGRWVGGGGGGRRWRRGGGRRGRWSRRGGEGAVQLADGSAHEAGGGNTEGGVHVRVHQTVLNQVGHVSDGVHVVVCRCSTALSHPVASTWQQSALCCPLPQMCEGIR